MATLVWPSISDTTLGFTPTVSISVAAVWRRSWKRMGGSPSRQCSGRGRRSVMRDPVSGSPKSSLKTKRQGDELLARSDNIVGPDGVTELVLPPLAAGTYFVQCDIHPFMTAALMARAPDGSATPPGGLRDRPRQAI